MTARKLIDTIENRFVNLHRIQIQIWLVHDSEPETRLEITDDMIAYNEETKTIIIRVD